MIEDDPDLIDKAHKRVRATFDTGKTKDYKYRLTQLKNFEKGIKAMEKEIQQGLSNDLGKDFFTNYMYEICSLYGELEEAITNLKTWMKV